MISLSLESKKGTLKHLQEDQQVTLHYITLQQVSQIREDQQVSQMMSEDGQHNFKIQPEGHSAKAEFRILLR